MFSSINSNRYLIDMLNTINEKVKKLHALLLNLQLIRNATTIIIYILENIVWAIYWIQHSFEKMSGPDQCTSVVCIQLALCYLFFLSVAWNRKHLQANYSHEAISEIQWTDVFSLQNNNRFPRKYTETITTFPHLKEYRRQFYVLNNNNLT